LRSHAKQQTARRRLSRTEPPVRTTPKDARQSSDSVQRLYAQSIHERTTATHKIGKSDRRERYGRA